MKAQQMKRGVVITPEFTFDGRTVSLSGGFDPIALRQYLLYWDKIDWPDNNIISIGDEHPDFEFLKQAGVLERTMVRFNSFSGNAGYAMLQMQVAALEKRSSEEPGSWCLAQHSNVLASSTVGTIDSTSIEVELYSAVPVPRADVPLQDILEFKEQRSDELLQFRAVMDELYQETIRAADIPRAKLQVHAKLQQALVELNATFEETFKQRLLASLKVELNLPNIAGLAMAGGAAASTFGISIGAGAALGAVAAALKFDLAHIRKGAAIPENLRDYAYLHHVERELG